MNAAPIPPSERRAPRRALLWGLLVLLLVVAQSLLVVVTVRYEATRSQVQTEDLGAEAALQLRRDTLRRVHEVQSLLWSALDDAAWRRAAVDLMRQHRELLRIERRNAALGVVDAVDTPISTPLFAHMPRSALDIDTEVACLAAQRAASPLFSRSYFVPLPGGLGAEVLDLCIPVLQGGRAEGFVVASFALAALLDGVLSAQQARGVELSVIEGDGARLARAGGARGAGVFKSEHIVDLPGASLRLRADSAASGPSLVPNVTLALAIVLSVALFAVVIALARDVRRRARAERALDEALAFRKAMEDSMNTGLRARDMDGRITYVNPAFCAMVGFTADELQRAVPPYWPPEHAERYAERHHARTSAALPAVREGLETEFMRKNGERFPVLIYEAPLLDRSGRQTGWMSTVLDVSAQRRIEELARAQQERLQASARLAMVGEMASLLSHELNQPLSAIASYAGGSLNLLAGEAVAANGAAAALPADGDTPALLRQALERIAEQAERAGRVIKSVHGFVRRREHSRETVGVDVLVESVLPLVRLQARKSGARIEVDLPPRPPRVVCDRTMVEQVLLNLARNGIQAMEEHTPAAERVLVVRARQTHAKWVTIGVVDAGHGIAPEVAARLFTPFFTTRSEGMGLGLSLCRTVIEQHGGALDFGPPPWLADAAGGAAAHDAPARRGTEFRFTLPAAPQAESGGPPRRDR